MILILIILVSALLTSYILLRLRELLDGKKTGQQFDSSQLSDQSTQLTFQSIDGLKISGTHFRINNPKGLIILSHGYHRKYGGARQLYEHSLMLNKMGYDTLLFNFRSFGESDGYRSTLGIEEWQDLAGAYKFAKEKLDYKVIGLYGFSMGAATTIIAAGKEQIGDFVIVLAPFARITNLFMKFLLRENYLLAVTLPFIYLAFFIKFGTQYLNVSPIRFVGQIKKPLLIIEAEFDKTVRAKDSEILHNVNPASVLEKAPTGHDIFVDNPTFVEKSIQKFLDKFNF